ncbi:MAG: putative transporter [Rikenellaceae bacterium]|nr:putative transporter [Rikenellaceae bacterium]
MNWFETLYLTPSPLQAVVVISTICALGLMLGRVHIKDISLGVTFVFFAGILLGHIGLQIDPQMLTFAQNFGLIIFVYELGLQVGPGFFSAFRSGGMRLNLYGLGVALVGTVMALGLTCITTIPLPDMMGILCGATTNTPALGAVQQTLSQLGVSANEAALSCAVTYPLGVVGMILAIIVIRRFFTRKEDFAAPEAEHVNNTYIAEYVVRNQAIVGKSLAEVAGLSNIQFVVSRVWRNGHVSIPDGKTTIELGDRLLATTSERDSEMLTVLFGEREQTDWNRSDVDWNTIDRKLLSRSIVITRPEINGKRLGSLRLRNSYGINISRIYRSGVPLLATPDLVLQLGDRVMVVGEEPSIERVERKLGNASKELSEPNLMSIFIGLILGLALGAVPLSMPGISAPVRLGLAGGPIIVGILVGAFGPRFGLITYTTRSANLMLRGLGLALYLACLGLDAGAQFFETVMRPEGVLWIAVGFFITIVPVLIVGIYALRINHLDYDTVCGMLCGSMANPMALNYVNNTIEGDKASVSYATVYPLAMFTKVVLVQLLLLFLM